LLDICLVVLEILVIQRDRDPIFILEIAWFLLELSCTVLRQ